MQYQAKPKLSPMKTDRGIKEGMAIDMTQLNMEGTQTIQAPSTPQMKPMSLMSVLYVPILLPFSM